MRLPHLTKRGDLVEYDGDRWRVHETKPWADHNESLIVRLEVQP